MKKEIKGDKPEKDSTFKFTFTRDDASYPMPDGETKDTLTLSITGAGEKEVGRIIFTKAGTYSYTVKEVNDKAAGYDYDTSVYKITYKVTEDASSKKLSCERTITKDGKAVKDQSGVAFTFTNTYSKTTPASGNGAKGASGPKTGDDTPVMTWLLMLLAAAAVGGTFIAVKRRRRRG